MEQIIKKAIVRIKENIKEQTDENVRLGMYMVLQTIKNEIDIKDAELLDKVGLKEDLEKYL
jgi:hypothetical protein